MSKLNCGFVQIYTGNGKGKTTAAIGQIVRASGFGLKSFMIQFMKEYQYSEITSLKKFGDSIEVVQCCRDDFVLKKMPPPKEEIQKARNGLNSTKEKMLSGEYDIIVLDEVCVAIYFGLITVEEVLDFIQSKLQQVELILTGRYCPKVLIDAADLVTDMNEVKHYYQKGILARKGIES